MSESDYTGARQADQDLDQDQAESMALRKLLYNLADVEPTDAGLVEAAARAVDRVDALETENEALRSRLQTVEGELDAVRSIGAEKTSKEEKVAQIVQYAENQRDDASVWRVTAKEIVGITGVSRRYAYDLIDADDGLPAEYDWAAEREPQSKPTGKDGGGTIEWKNALEIDFEQLHTDPESVNKFTTRSPGTAGSE